MGLREDREPATLLPLHENRDGFWVGQVHYAHNPDFDFESACRGMSAEDIRTELEIDWLSGTGLPVYPTFKRQTHVATGPIEYWPSQPLYAAWDWGLEPACGLSTINSLGQWCLLPSFHPEAREFVGVYDFASHVAEHLTRKYAEPHGLNLGELELIHHGDPAGRAVTPQPGQRANEKLSAFQVLNQGIRLYLGEDDDGTPVYDQKPGWGWHVIPGAVSVTERLEAIKGRLGTLLDGQYPGLLIDPREEFGISCFLGGYHYKQFSDGRFDRHPDKGHASHLMNCWEYTATRLWMRTGDRRLRDGETEQDRDRPEPFRSQSSSFHRY
jgi:hypothetical protein